jgi:hypothetical protein
MLGLAGNGVLGGLQLFDALGRVLPQTWNRDSCEAKFTDTFWCIDARNAVSMEAPIAGAG